MTQRTIESARQERHRRKIPGDADVSGSIAPDLPPPCFENVLALAYIMVALALAPGQSHTMNGSKTETQDPCFLYIFCPSIMFFRAAHTRERLKLGASRSKPNRENYHDHYDQRHSRLIKGASVLPRSAHVIFTRNDNRSNRSPIGSEVSPRDKRYPS